MKKRIIMDFDNTMGVEGRDVDDGLALLYLLGSPDAQVEGICTTFGNSTIDVVHENTERMFETMGLDIPLFKGGGSPAEAESDAARYLARTAAENDGEITVVATGSLTNLRGASLIDADFYRHLAGVYIMGGYTESLPFHGKFVDELNTSCDPDAIYGLIEASTVGRGDSAQYGGKPGCPVTVATAQACLPATFSYEGFNREFGDESWVVRACKSWFRNMEEEYDWPHAVCWDVVAAAALMQPDLFEFEEYEVTLYRRYFTVGYFERAHPDAPSSTILIPKIVDRDRFISEVFQRWHRGCELTELNKR